ncbi:hypothetical protein [Rhizobium sp. BR 314]|uniref:hypothetical protein n=1 Tax=Rhizobium sp. BR 314 TaxID=3040013 RepID=UPI0039BFC4D6
MVRFVFAGLAMLTLVSPVAAEEDYGPVLVALFAKTCAIRPALPSELARIVTGLGFVSEDKISADMEAGPQIDIVYRARFAGSGRNVSLSAYFGNSVTEPDVSCSLNTIGVSADALPGLIEKSLDAHDRTEQLANDGNRFVASWRTGAAQGSDTIGISAWRTSPQRTSISITYHSRKQ